MVTQSSNLKDLDRMLEKGPLWAIQSAWELVDAKSTAETVSKCLPNQGLPDAVVLPKLLLCDGSLLSWVQDVGSWKGYILMRWR